MSLPSPSRRRRGAHAYRDGLHAEHCALASLSHLGYTLLAQRLKTPHGEIDLIVTKEDWIVAVEVKYRKQRSDTPYALTTRQKERLLNGFSYLLDTHPEWHKPNTRFDVMLVDSTEHIHHIEDALRLM